jgi:hypothetical protein
VSDTLSVRITKDMLGTFKVANTFLREGSLFDPTSSRSMAICIDATASFAQLNSHGSMGNIPNACELTSSELSELSLY